MGREKKNPLFDQASDRVTCLELLCEVVILNLSSKATFFHFGENVIVDCREKLTNLKFWRRKLLRCSRSLKGMLVSVKPVSTNGFHFSNVEKCHLKANSVQDDPQHPKLTKTSMKSTPSFLKTVSEPLKSSLRCVECHGVQFRGFYPKKMS
jgi:hypothetical protein